MKYHPVATEDVVVVPLTPEGRNGLELVMVRRRDRRGGARESLAFPRGTVSPEDCLAEAETTCRGLDGESARRILGSELAPERALGFWVAAARILYIDHGILLCTAKDGRALDPSGEPWAQTLSEKRRQLIDGNFDFIRHLESKGLCCDLNLLAYFSQWNSGDAPLPAQGVRTFLARLPCPAALPPDGESAREPLWITPETALEYLDRGVVRMDFFTFATLRRLVDFDSPEALWAEYGSSGRPGKINRNFR